MELADVMAGAEMVQVKDAARLLSRTENTIRRQLREGELVGKHFGNQWMVPMLKDEQGRAVFLIRERA
jgi:DeoR/GlpR family transcriptional regulator of sugar metabolism